uniref:F-box domain-containing protein n=1 Tax=Caenorhabditis japonica TaxID=281687 RepID=A0A8R1DGT9_CAEJA
MHVKMDEQVEIYWRMEMESGVRTLVHRQYNGKEEKVKRQSVMISSREYLERILKWILERYRFKKIHLGMPGLAPLFANYTHRVEDVGISDEVEYLELAEKFCPCKLALSQPTVNNRRRGTLNLRKFPQLEELIMYGVPLDLDQFVESKLIRVTADTITKKIKLKHANKLIENWKRGVLNYKTIRISSEPSRVPIKVPHQQWTALHDEREDSDVFYDDVENNRKKIGSFRYSPKSFEFVSWEENGGKEPSFFFNRCF